jgi:hypothetical protein
LVAADEAGGAVLALHGEGFLHFAKVMVASLHRFQLGLTISEAWPADLPAALLSGKPVRGIEVRLGAPEQARDHPQATRLGCVASFLADSAEQLGLCLLRQHPPQDLNGIARLDRLRLLPVAQGLDGQAGLALELQESEHCAGCDLADFVDHQDRIPAGCEFAALDRPKERVHGDRSDNASILEGVCLLPARRQSQNVPTTRIKTGIGLPGLDQRLDQRGLPGARHACEQREGTSLAKRIDRRPLGSPVIRL